jgi:hypothetical protein
VQREASASDLVFSDGRERGVRERGNRKKKKKKKKTTIKKKSRYVNSE